MFSGGISLSQTRIFIFIVQLVNPETLTGSHEFAIVHGNS